MRDVILTTSNGKKAANLYFKGGIWAIYFCLEFIAGTRSMAKISPRKNNGVFNKIVKGVVIMVVVDSAWGVCHNCIEMF